MLRKICLINLLICTCLLQIFAMHNAFAEKESCAKGDYAWLEWNGFDACTYLSKYPELTQIINTNFSGKPRKDIDISGLALGAFNRVIAVDEREDYGIITSQEEFSRILQGQPLPQIDFARYSCIFVANRSSYISTIREIKEFPDCVRIIIHTFIEDIPIGGSYTALYELPRTDKKIIFVELLSVQGQRSCIIREAEKVIFQNELR